MRYRCLYCEDRFVEAKDRDEHEWQCGRNRSWIMAGKKLDTWREKPEDALVCSACGENPAVELRWENATTFQARFNLGGKVPDRFPMFKSLTLDDDFDEQNIPVFLWEPFHDRYDKEIMGRFVNASFDKPFDGITGLVQLGTTSKGITLAEELTRGHPYHASVAVGLITLSLVEVVFFECPGLEDTLTTGTNSGTVRQPLNGGST